MSTRTLPHPPVRRPAAAAVVVGALLIASGCGGTSPGPAGTTANSSPSTATTLRVHHPNGLSYVAPIAAMRAAPDAPTATFDTWASPDIMRSLVTSGQTDLIATPSYVGANLFNKGVNVRLLAITVGGSLHLMGPGNTPKDWSALKGKTIVQFFKGDMPDLVTTYLLKKNGLEPGRDVTIQYVSDAAEVSSALVGGRADYGVLPEQAATVTTMKAKESGHDLVPLFDLQQEWGKATGQTVSRIPQAGILVRGDLPEKDRQALEVFARSMSAAITRLNEGDDAAVTAAADAADLPVALTRKVMPRLNLEYVPAAQARPELERFYTELATLDPQIIGGRLPDAGFYLDDLR